MDNFSAYRVHCFIVAIQSVMRLSNDAQWALHYAELQRLAIPGNEALPGFDYTILQNLSALMNLSFPASIMPAANNSGPVNHAVQGINRQPCQHCRRRKQRVSACQCLTTKTKALYLP